MIGYSRHQFDRNGVPLVCHVSQRGTRPVVFQHGLCGDAAQPAEVFPQRSNFRHFVLECRGHGASAAGDLDDLTIASFSDDLAAMIEAEGIGPCPVGGISMGAAIALRLAVTRPELVSALVLARPAWFTANAPENMKPNAEVGRLIAKGMSRDAFLGGETARSLAKDAPDNLASLLAFFDREPLGETSKLLTRISADGPGISATQIAQLAVPTLILVCEDDAIHPIAHGKNLHHLIAQSSFAIMPAKGRNRTAYVNAMRAALTSFLEKEC